MAKSVRVRLKAIRKRAKMTVQEVADELGVPKSTYASKEDKFKAQYLPVDLTRALARIFGPKGIPREEVLELGGIIERADDDVPDHLSLLGTRFVEIVRQWPESERERALEVVRAMAPKRMRA